MLKLRDQLNRHIVLDKVPERIISLVPSQTELLCDMGLTDAIVGVTKFCVHPEKLKSSKPIVGGTKQLHYDKIQALKPDIVLCNKEENTKEIIETLEKFTVVHVSDIYTLEDSLALIGDYGTLFKREQQAKDLIAKTCIELKKLKAFVKNQPSYKVAYFIWREPWMVAASHTFINHLLELNGFVNYYAALERYPEIMLEDLHKDSSNIDFLFLSSEPYPFKEKHIKEIAAVLTKTKSILVDGEYFSWYGSRLLGAFNYFKKLRIELNDL